MKVLRNNIVVFGTGATFENRKHLLENYKVVALADNDKEKIGKSIDGVKIISPKYIKDKQFDYVIIMAKDHWAIKNQLLNMCVGYEKIRTYVDIENDFIQGRLKKYYKKHNKQERISEFSGKKAIYTAIIGDYDELLDPYYIDEDVDYICFTDECNCNSRVWKIVHVDRKLYESYMYAKYIKLFPNKLLKDYDWSIWVDANVLIKQSIIEMVKQYTHGSPMLCFLHPTRNDFRSEAKACVKEKKDKKENIDSVLNYMMFQGYEKSDELYCGGILVREHNNSIVKNTMEDWWFVISHYCKRDQLSLDYAFWRNSFYPDITDMNIYNNSFFEVKSHKTL